MASLTEYSHCYTEPARLISFGGRWSKCEDSRLRAAVAATGVNPVDWDEVALLVFHNTRSSDQCRSRWEKVIRPGLVKGPWTPAEDEVRRRAIKEYCITSSIVDYR